MKKFIVRLIMVTTLLCLLTLTAFAKDGYWTSGNSQMGVSLRVTGINYTGHCSFGGSPATAKVRVSIKIYDYFAQNYSYQGDSATGQNSATVNYQLGPLTSRQGIVGQKAYGYHDNTLIGVAGY